MARYFETGERVYGALRRHGGEVHRRCGHGGFRVPTVHDDDALRALRAAVELRDALVVLNRELELDYGVSLVLRTGVNSGEVVAGDR